VGNTYVKNIKTNKNNIQFTGIFQKPIICFIIILMYIHQYVISMFILRYNFFITTANKGMFVLQNKTWFKLLESNYLQIQMIHKINEYGIAQASSSSQHNRDNQKHKYM